MRVLYIGHYNEGSTSRMRGEYLKELLPIKEFTLINIDIPLAGTTRLFRSFGWRYKKGPLIKNIKQYILKSLGDNFSFDLVWIDKGVFIEPGIIHKLRKHSAKLIHFTPDPAFTYHRSQLFYDAISAYDYCVTTKSFEIANYQFHGVKTIFCTQGYDPKVHKPYHNFNDKSGIVFIGHKEEEREYVIAKLVESKIQVTVAGNHWDGFAKKRAGNQSLIYKGKGVYGDEYAKSISGAMMSLGFLSKWIPELHTTRTFEIPACRTALVTERNKEIGSIFSEDDVIYYDSPDEVVEKISFYLSNKVELKNLTARGHEKVVSNGYSYREILVKIITQMGLDSELVNPINILVNE